MCPPAAATRDESLSTRARANVLQGLLCGALALDGPDAAELGEVLGTCVACKACKTECPAGVDMAALKVEWLAELRSREGVPPLARAVGDFRRLARLGSPIAPIVNALGSVAGGARGRRPPRRGPRAAASRFRREALQPRRGEATRPRTSSSFADCFIEFQEPEVGAALIDAPARRAAAASPS